MAGSEYFYDSNTKTHETRTTKDSGDVARSQSAARLQDASSIKPKAMGRGMQPGESVQDWKARLRRMDNETQKQALTR